MQFKPMKEEIKKLWVEALTSGEYTQTGGALCSGSAEQRSFCCLGVLCDLYAKDQGLEWVPLRDEETRHALVIGATKEPSFLPNEVMDWSGLLSNNGEFAEFDVEELEDRTANLADKNDDLFTFEEIAELINKYF